MNIRLGKAVTEFPNISQIKAAGYDWIFAPQSIFSEMSDSVFRTIREEVESAGVKFSVCSLDFPGEVMVTGQGFNEYIWLEYYKKVVSRLSALGCTALCWSNGDARFLPEEGETAWAKEQVMQFLFLVSGYAEKHNIRLLIEPLGEEKTNYLNSMLETVQFIESIDSENLGIAVTDTELTAGPELEEDFLRFKDYIQLVTFNESPDHPAGTQLVELLKSSRYGGPVLLTGDAELKDFQQRFSV